MKSVPSCREFWHIALGQIVHTGCNVHTGYNVHIHTGCNVHTYRM